MHTSLAAPDDETTGQPMALEVLAHTVRFGSHDLTAGASSWRDLLCERDPRLDTYADTPIEERLMLRIEAATYANVFDPGIGVGLYL